MLLRGSVKLGVAFVLGGFPISISSTSRASQKPALCRGVFSTPHFPRQLYATNSFGLSCLFGSLASCKSFALRTSLQSLLGTHKRSAMGWACATCTFINNSGSMDCSMCSQFSVASSGDAEWTCESCTFINLPGTAFCEMCEMGRSVPKPSSSISSRLGVSVGDTSFRPLRASAMSELGPGRTEGGPLKKDAKLEREIVVLSDAKVGEEEAQIASSSINPKSRKRKAKEEDVIVLSEDSPDVKDDKKESGEEPNQLLKKLHKERMARLQWGASASGGSDTQRDKGVISLSSLSKEQRLAYIESEGTWLEKASAELILLSYNVWFREDLELQARLDAIGDTILQHRPHIVFFQEVTENIFNIFQQASWWKSYKCSVKPGVAAQRAYFCLQLSKLPVVSFSQQPFQNSVMGRELCIADLDTGKGARLLVATTHLESPCPAPPTWNQMFSPERVVQLKEAMRILKDSPNVIFGGDMNWDDKLDGPPPLPPGWFDAWLQLCPGQVGYTYDTKANRMLTGNRSLQKRLDRVFCQLHDFEVVSLEMVGTEPIPDLIHLKEKKVKGQVQMLKLPVLPSDHFGLLLKVRRKSE